MSHSMPIAHHGQGIQGNSQCHSCCPSNGLGALDIRAWPQHAAQFFATRTLMRHVNLGYHTHWSVSSSLLASLILLQAW